MRKQDRRVSRTRGALEAALIELLEHTDYQDITVQAICDTADVGRSAFYQHFTSKDDLFRSGFDRLRRDLDAAAYAAPEENGSAAPKVIEALFVHAEKHAGLYRSVTTGHGGFIALRIIEGTIAQTLGTALLAEAAIPPAEAEVRALMYASASMAALRWWFQNHNRPERDEMVRLVHSAFAVGNSGRH